MPFALTAMACDLDPGVEFVVGGVFDTDAAARLAYRSAGVRCPRGRVAVLSWYRLIHALPRSIGFDVLFIGGVCIEGFFSFHGCW